ncbi:MAG: hypothetical protein QOC83_768 [Pseudonocardiales bacterium]|jgi:hypothetical protein|nr:hypothetical protein [Pseudonocardiales bacterium]MDT7667433.1 hypothetical protein [Pseudonocardiales bacterium]
MGRSYPLAGPSGHGCSTVATAMVREAAETAGVAPELVP